MIAARATILPAGVSTVTSRLLQAMRLTGVDSETGRPSPSFAIERSETLAAGEHQIVVARANLVDHREILEIFARETGAQHEVDGAGPVAQVLRQCSRAGDVASARSVIESAIGLDQGRQKILGLAGAGVPAADADLLARRRGHDLEAGGTGQLDHGIGVGIVHPARAAVEGNLETRSVGDAAAADLVRRLDHDDLAVRRLDPPCRGNAGRTGADHDNVGLARQRSAECAPVKHRGRCNRRRRRKEAAPRHCHVMVSECFEKRE